MRVHFEARAQAKQPLRLIERSLDALDATGLAAKLRFAYVGGRKVATGAWPELRSRLKPEAGRTLQLREAELDYDVDDDSSVNVFLGSLAQTCTITVEGPARHGAAQLDALEQLMIACHDAATDAVWSRCAITMKDVDWEPSAELPPAWEAGNVVDFVDLKGGHEEAKRVASAPLPKGAQRRRHGDLVIIRWLESIGTAKQAVAAMKQQEAWLTATIAAPTQAKPDGAGDERVVLGKPEEVPGLTFYVPDDARGYKAVVPTDRGKLSAADAKALSALVRKRKVGDGRPLEALTLIVPSREDAVALRDEATQLGCDRIVYVDANDGRVWWNPFPAKKKRK